LLKPDIIVLAPTSGRRLAGWLRRSLFGLLSGT
jgi:hypothetical protein